MFTLQMQPSCASLRVCADEVSTPLLQMASLWRFSVAVTLAVAMCCIVTLTLNEEMKASVSVIQPVQYGSNPLRWQVVREETTDLYDDDDDSDSVIMPPPSLS